MPLTSALLTVVRFLGAEAKGEVVPHGALFNLYGAIRPDVVHVRRSRSKGEGSPNGLRQLLPRFLIRGIEETFEIPQDVNVLVEHGLEVSCRAVVQDLPPIRRFRIWMAAADQRHPFGEVEELPEAPCDLTREVPRLSARAGCLSGASGERSQGAHFGACHSEQSQDVAEIGRWSTEALVITIDCILR